MNLRSVAVMASLTLALLSTSARASYVINIDQNGKDVVASGSGSLDLSGLEFDRTVPAQFSGILPQLGIIVVGTGSGDLYNATITGSSNFGSGGPAFADAVLGDVFGITASMGQVAVPAGYRSGAFIGLSTDTFMNTTLAMLGLTPGSQYIFSVSGVAQEEALFTSALSDPNTVTINIGGVSAVPLPASAPMFGVALLSLAGVGYAAKRKKAAAAA